MHQEHKELLWELYETYQKALRLATLGRNIPECEIGDIIQDVFVALMDKYGDRFPDWSKAQRKGMLMKIFRNRCNDYFRNLKRHEEISIDAKDADTEAEILRNQIKKDASDVLIKKEELMKIRESILSMTPALRDVALLHLIEGKPREQVCECLKIKDSTCRMRISRVRSILKKLFKEMDQFS